jgi:hypothetical protein
MMRWRSHCVTSPDVPHQEKTPPPLETLPPLPFLRVLLTFPNVTIKTTGESRVSAGAAKVFERFKKFQF